MDAQKIETYRSLKACLDFHGHICPGLSIGYKASILAIELLREQRAEDEELVAIVENDSCFVDAVQVITGCTFGKGNLLYRDYGKMAFTLASRRTRKGIRVSLREEFSFTQGRRDFMDLFEKILQGSATEEERRHFREIQSERAERILSMHPDSLFRTKEVEVELPEMARLIESENCDRCGELTMKTKMVECSGKRLCKPCAIEVERCGR